MFCLFSPSNPIVHEGNLRRRPPSWETLTGHRYTRGNSGTTEPTTIPVVPLFPASPKLGGHNSEKRRNIPGIQGQRTAGIIEVIFSHIWTAKVRVRWNLACNGFFQGPVSGFGRGCLTIIIPGADRESERAPLLNPGRRPTILSKCEVVERLQLHSKQFFEYTNEFVRRFDDIGSSVK